MYIMFFCKSQYSCILAFALVLNSTSAYRHLAIPMHILCDEKIPFAREAFHAIRRMLQ